MVEIESKDPGGVTVPIAFEDPASTYDASVEPAYGWVVCISMHLINGFTWGIIAVCIMQVRASREYC